MIDKYFDLTNEHESETEENIRIALPWILVGIAWGAMAVKALLWLALG